MKTDYSSYDIRFTGPLNPKINKLYLKRLNDDGFKYQTLYDVDVSLIFPHFSINMFMDLCKQYTSIIDDTICINACFYNKIKKIWPYDVLRNIRHRDVFYTQYFSFTDIRNILKRLNYKFTMNMFNKYRKSFYYYYSNFSRSWEDRVDINTVDEIILDLGFDKKYTYKELSKKFVYSDSDITEILKVSTLEERERLHRLTATIRFNDTHQYYKLLSRSLKEFSEQDKDDIIAAFLKSRLKNIGTINSNFQAYSLF